MNRLFVITVLCFNASQSIACPNLSGRYGKQYEDGMVYFNVRQVGCEKVQINDESYYLGKQNPDTAKIFLPDGKRHSNDIPVSRWHGGRLEIWDKNSSIYYMLDSAGNLHFSDGLNYPQCKGICDEIAMRVIDQEK